MPKRTNSEKIEHYKKKLRKLEERQEKQKYQRIIVYSEDSEQDELPQSAVDENVPPINGVGPLQEVLEETLRELQPDPEPCTSSLQNQTQSSQDIPVTLSPEEPALDPELLSALGEYTSDTPEFGEKVHDSLAKLWLPILKKGLSKEDREKALKQYLVPDNCRFLQAPKLNAEISAAVSEVTRGRDKKCQIMQQQLGQGIAAANQGMNVLLTSDNKIGALKALSDSCRILTDLHSFMTKDRMKLIIPCLDKNFLHVIQDSERDNLLFGEKLADKIKASKAIERQGQLIRKSVPTQRSNPQNATNVRPTPAQGNWPAPRFPFNRGGARGRQETISAADNPPCIHHEPTKSSAAEQATCASSVTSNQTATPSAHQPYPGCRDAIGTAFSRRGVPSAAMSLMLASLSENTLRQYSVTLKLWWAFCADNEVDPFDATSTLVLKFLSQEFDRGCSHGTLNGHRSALVLLLGSNICANDCIKRLLKGAYRLNPSVPKYTHTWDPQLVLNLISSWYPNLELSLEKLSMKLVVLLALCTAHRVQTFSLIKIENIFIFENHIKIQIPNLIKTSAPGREQPVLNLPFFRENPKICPASTLEAYISITRNKRVENQGALLLTHRTPHKAATSQTISRWIKQVLSVSGIDVSTFSAHSTRHASTSAARAAGVSIDVIRKTAGWSISSNTFAKFYNRPLNQENEQVFARAVCSRRQTTD